MAELGKTLYDRGYVAGSAGNMSVRLENNIVLMTPSGSCMGRLDPEALSAVDPDGKLVAGPRPSKEIEFHLAIYRNDSACSAIVHLHSTWATILSCRGDLDRENPIKPFSPYFVMKIGTLQVIPYYPPGDPSLARDMVKWAGKRNAFLLRNHGFVVLAGTLSEAVDLAEELEETAKLAGLMKDNEIKYLSKEEIDFLRKK